MKALITGVSGYFGQLLADRLRNDPAESFDVIGIDIRELEDQDEKGMKFLSGDTRKKRIEDIFKVEGDIDVVVHLAREGGSDRTSDELMMTNVYGAYHMLELSQKYGVKKFIFPSASVVYGARNDNPALINECHPLLGNRDIPRVRDRVEADIICQTFAHGASMKVVILRFAPIWRDKGAGTLQKYMAGDMVPTLMGFDPMFQMIYEDEVIESFMLAVKNPDAFGAYNIPGRVFMPLSNVIRHLGKKPLPLPEFLVHRNGEFLWSKKLRFDFNFLKYPFAIDGGRAKRELGYNPGGK